LRHAGVKCHSTFSVPGVIERSMFVTMFAVPKHYRRVKASLVLLPAARVPALRFKRAFAGGHH
jgi:hypothetical protein